MQKQYAFHLIELSITLSILALLTALATPNFSNQFQKNNAESLAREVRALLTSARYTAITHNQRMTLCGINNSRVCTRDNFTTAAVFQDKNNNRAIDSDEEVYYETQIDFNGQLQLRASNSRFIAFKPSGYAQPFGSIFICTADKNKKNFQRVTVSRAGKIYIARKTGNSNIVLDAESKVFNCEA